jgi:alanine racemase
MSQGERESEIQAGHSAQLTVRMGALATNYTEVRRRAADALIAPVVKADAYRIGMVPVAKALASEGADLFFVARVEEGIVLRAVVPGARIFVFDGVAPGSAPALIAHRLTPVLNSADEIAEWSRAATARKSMLDAAIHVDTGMNRSGLSASEVGDLSANARKALSGINLNLIMSHLACADDPDHGQNRRQLERFRAALAVLPSAPASLAASAGIELGHEYLFDVVRPGMALYGGNPVPSRTNPYRPVVVLSSQVLQLRKLDTGDTVGYGASFTARRPTTLAIVALGYADGLIRASGAKGRAAIGGVLVPFAGRISMDLLALDVTDVPDHAVHRGAPVEFLGDTISIEDAARAAGTITHEVLTAISLRARRVYSGD